MHDFSSTNPEDMYYKILADRVRYFKENEKEVLTMCKEMENMLKESSHERAVEIAKRMLLSDKLTYEDITSFTDLTLEKKSRIWPKKLHNKRNDAYTTHLSIYVVWASFII